MSSSRSRTFINHGFLGVAGVALFALLPVLTMSTAIIVVGAVSMAAVGTNKLIEISEK